MMLSLQSELTKKRDSGSKILVPYITGGLGQDWLEVITAVVDAGADAVEVGIPFSDPMIDGPTIQRASQLALNQGATPISVLGALGGFSPGVPMAAMTYYNLIHHAGEERFAGWLADAGVSGAIFPDLPFEEGESWRRVAVKAGIETVQLVAPTTPRDRSAILCEHSRGFVYGVGVMGTTGERISLQKSAIDISQRLKSLTDKVVLVGIGISTPEQAAEVSKYADGVVMGSALVHRLLTGEGPKGAYEFIARVREAIDQA